MTPKAISGAVCFFHIVVLIQETTCVGNQNAGQFCKDFNQSTSHDISSDVREYHLYQAIKVGLANNSENLYNIQKAGLKQKSDSKIACLSVGFELWQIAINTSSGCTVDVNGTEIVFLWTSFDTSIYFGSLLLNYTWYDLRVFGFGWEYNCELYRAPVMLNINISISADKTLCVTKDKLCSALQYITTMVSIHSNACILMAQ